MVMTLWLADRNAVDQCEHHARQHAAKDAADGTLHRFVGTDDGGQLVLAEGPACKVSAGVTAPGEAENQQDKVDGIIADTCRKGQAALEVDQRVEAEHE